MTGPLVVEYTRGYVSAQVPCDTFCHNLKRWTESIYLFPTKQPNFASCKYRLNLHVHVHLHFNHIAGK